MLLDRLADILSMPYDGLCTMDAMDLPLLFFLKGRLCCMISSSNALKPGIDDESL